MGHVVFCRRLVSLYINSLYFFLYKRVYIIDPVSTSLLKTALMLYFVSMCKLGRLMCVSRVKGGAPLLNTHTWGELGGPPRLCRNKEILTDLKLHRALGGVTHFLRDSHLSC